MVLNDALIVKSLQWADKNFFFFFFFFLNREEEKIKIMQAFNDFHSIFNSVIMK